MRKKMTQDSVAENGETSRKRQGVVGNGEGSGRAGKRLRALEASHKATRKRAHNEMVQTDLDMSLDDSPNSRRIWKKTEARDDALLRNDLRTVNLREGESEVVVNRSEVEAAESAKQKTLEPLSQSRETSERGPSRLSRRKWKKTGAIAKATVCTRALDSVDAGLDNSKSGSEEEDASSLPQKEEGKLEKNKHPNEVIRKGFETVTLRERSEKEPSRVRSEAETIPSSQIKRRKANKRDESPEHSEKKTCRDEKTSLMFTNTSQGKQGGTTQKTWKRVMRENHENVRSPEDLGVPISDAWKRLREEKFSSSSGSSTDGRLESDLCMSSEGSDKEPVKKKAKRPRLVKPGPLQGKTWKRRMRDRREDSSGKRLREESTSDYSGSSGSDVAHAYLQNRMWKRPRFEKLVSIQGKAWRRHHRDVELTEGSTRKRPQCGTTERPTKRQRK